MTQPDDIQRNDVQPPLLETRDLVLQDGQRMSVGSIQVAGPSLACEGTAGLLVRALGDRRLVQTGTLLVRGRPVEALLAEGTAAYVPLGLPLPRNTRVLSGLVLSARLIGADKSDAERALSACRMSAHAQRKIGELTRLQTRLVALAHGICGGPGLLILEDIYQDLDEADIEVVDAILATALDGASYIVAVSRNAPGSRDLMLASGQVLLGTSTRILPPCLPSEVPSRGHWVTCAESAEALAEKLKSGGATVVRSPHPSVLLVLDAPGPQIFQAAREVGSSILELYPHASEGFVPSHATSRA